VGEFNLARNRACARGVTLAETFASAGVLAVMALLVVLGLFISVFF
jgi:hypothetical protein